MAMYERILVPLDGSTLAEHVLPYARALSRALHAPIELLQAFDPVPLHWVKPEHGVYLDRLTSSFHGHALEYLESIGASLRNLGVEVSCSAHEGDPAFVIVTEAQKEPNTLIAIASHGRSGITRWALGSVMDKVLHATTNPMLVVRSRDNQMPTDDLGLKSVIIPLDGSALAEESLPDVVALTKALGLKAILVRVTPHFEAESLSYLHKIGEDLRIAGVPTEEERLLHGQPADSIVDFAQEVEDNLVAMTTHGHSGLGRWLLGSVTDRVVQHSGDPVLVVRSSR